MGTLSGLGLLLDFSLTQSKRAFGGLRWMSILLFGTVLLLFFPLPQERAARFAFAGDRNRYTEARAILRQLLGGYLGEPQNVVLGTLPHGKPILAATARIPGMRNLAPSHEFALCAFCLGMN
jgi:phosphopantetheinyl transferase